MSSFPRILDMEEDKHCALLYIVTAESRGAVIYGPRRKYPGEAVPLGCHLNVECDRQSSHFSAFLKIIVVRGLPFPVVEG